MMQFQNSSDAIKELRGKAPSGENLNEPAVKHSEFVSIQPEGKFSGSAGKAKISLRLDDGISSNAEIYRAGPDTAYAFVRMDTTIVNGKAEAQTDQGGVFVVGSGVNLGLVVGLVVAGLVVLVLALMAAGVIVYFVARPDKWKSTKESVKKSQMKIKRSFARQV